MTDEGYEMTESSGKKGNRTLWIILGIVAVILICCCCLMVLGVLIAGLSIFSIDTYDQFSSLLSLL